MKQLFKRLITNYRQDKQFKKLSKSDDFNKKMLSYLFDDTKTFFRLTSDEKEHLNTQIETCSVHDFESLNFDLGVFKDGELSHLMSCLNNSHSMTECDNAYSYLCDNFPSFNDRTQEEED